MSQVQSGDIILSANGVQVTETWHEGSMAWDEANFQTRWNFRYGKTTKKPARATLRPCLTCWGVTCLEAERCNRISGQPCLEPFPPSAHQKNQRIRNEKGKQPKLELHWDLLILMEFQTPGRHRAFCTSPHRALAAAKTVVSPSRMSRLSSVCWCNWGAPEAESDESDESPGATAGATDFLWVNHSADVWDQKLLGLRTIPFGGGLFAGIAICISLSL